MSLDKAFETCDVLIVGSGVAGMSLALQLPDTLSILLVAKSDFDKASSWRAQGGISAVLEDTDSVEDHVTDTLIAGAGITNRDAAFKVASNGKACIDWLLQQQVPFTVDDHSEKLHLTKEGGHSHRRIVHAADATGFAVSNTLKTCVEQRPNIHILTHYCAIDLITRVKRGGTSNDCRGAYLLDTKTGDVIAVAAKNVALASGGASKVYLYTSNPDGSTGDGIAMAWRAGCRVANMEFNQFHPTCLYHPKAKSFLISEAVRGEGGILRLADGTRFMPNFDERAELAPRDVVARAIDHEMKRLGEDCVYLDITHRSPEFIKQHFPTIHQRCLELGIDITKEPIPVVPASHYTCGGIVADEHGQTDLPGLYAIGEAAYSGLHGANRLASNSLLECLVYAHAASKHIAKHIQSRNIVEEMPHWDASRVTDSNEQVVVTHNWHELRQLMWDYVGIVRTNKRLERALRRIELLRNEVADYYGHFTVNSDLLELRNLVCVAELIVQSALQRQESRGLHFTLDYPTSDDKHFKRPTVLTPRNFSPEGAIDLSFT